VTAVATVLEAEDRLADSLVAHVGEWVAVRDHEVVETAKTLKALLGKIDTNGIDRILEVTKDSDSSFLL
jgi:hypothetical protein